MTVKSFVTSGGILGQLLLLYPVIISIISRQRDSDEITVIDNSALIQIIFTFFVLIISSIKLYNSKLFRFYISKTPIKWFLIYVAIGLLSTIWSVDWKMTFYRSIENFAYILLISGSLLTVYRRFLSLKFTLDWVLFYGFFYIMIKTVKRSLNLYDTVFSFEAIFLEQLNSTPFFFLALFLSTNFFIKLLILPTSIFSLSNTAYVGMFAGSLGFLKGNKGMQVLVILLTGTLSFIILYFGVNVFLENTIFYGQGGIGFEYTTGRNQIFEDALTAAFIKPILGYGFVAGEVLIITSMREGVIGAHNGFISAFLGMGIIGLVPFVIFYAKMFLISLDKKLPKKVKSVYVASVIFITIYTIGNPGIGTRVYGSWISSTLIFTLICISYMHFKYIKKL